MAAIKEIYAIPAGRSGIPGPAPGQGDPMLQAASLEAGGIPGQAEGQPPGGAPGIGPELQSALPASVGRALASVAPGP